MAMHTNSPKAAKRPKSSSAARRLILATIKRFGSQRRAAYALRLRHHMYMMRMLRGEISDTPEMKMALKRADERAKRAWQFMKFEERDENKIEAVELQALLQQVKGLERQIESLLPKANGKQK